MLPKNLKYGSKVESAMARSYRTNIAPQNGTGNYNLGDTIIVNVPTRNNLCLVPTESYLKFNALVGSSNSTTDLANIRWDSCGAHGLIQRIRIFHGSNLLQDIDNYGLLAKLLFDLQVPTDSAYGKYNVLAGLRGDIIGTTPTFSAPSDMAGVVTALSSKPMSVVNVNSGDVANANITKPAANGTAYGSANTYCLNLISLLGTLCAQNYIPLWGATSAPIRMEIQLVDSLNKALAASVTGGLCQISNCEYVGNFIELSDSAMSMVNESLAGQPLQFVVPDYRNFQYSYALTNGSSTQVNFPIPAKFSSLKSIFVAIRDKNNSATFFPYSSITAGITDYQFRVGSQLMPSRAVNTIQEMFSEVLKAIGSMSDLNHQPSIDKNSYALSASVANDSIGSASSGSYYIGLDLENYCTAPKDSIFTGYNSNTDDIFAVMNFGTSQPSGTVRFDAFAMFDEVVVFENNTCFVKF